MNTIRNLFLSNTNDWCYREEAKQYYKEYCEENGVEYDEDAVLDWALEEAQFSEECDWENFKHTIAGKSKIRLIGKESNYHSWSGNHEVYDKVFDKDCYTILNSIIFDGSDKTYQFYLKDGKIHLVWSDHDSPCGGTHLVFKKVGGYFTLREVGLR